jgi:dihydropteroate synthase
MLQRPHYEWQLRTRTLSLGARTLLMGIVNLTPDSFSDGGHFLEPAKAIDHALRLLDEGADILDLGAESTRPGAQLTLTPAEEQQRLAPVLEGILHARPDTILSVDTFHATTAAFSLTHGAEIVNDVSGMQWDADMPKALAENAGGLVLMHTRGKPGEWKEQQPLAEEEILPLVQTGLAATLASAKKAGIAEDRIVLDPGFGFGKRGTENFVLLERLAQLHSFHRPLLIGLSRKGFLAPELSAHERLPATLAANRKAIEAGAHILRVHDVAAHRELADSLR